MTNQKYLQIKIGGVDYSEHLGAPMTIQETGTEQLGTAMVTLNYMRTDAKFPPFTPVEIGGGKYSYVIANDAVKEVFGRKRWNHELTLIDATKATERVLMEAKSFTQPQISDFTENVKKPKILSYKRTNDDGSLSIDPEKYFVSSINSGTYVSPIEIPSDKFRVFSWNAITSSLGGDLELDDVNTTTVSIYYDPYLFIHPDLTKYLVPIYTSKVSRIGSLDLSAKLFQKAGIYSIIYDSVYTASGIYLREILAVPISIVDSTKAKDPYTLYDVLEILLETAEPLRRGLDTPRYSLGLTSEQEARFKAMQSPELHFSNGRSLYENLSVIGKVVHAIPRVSSDGVVTFKDLGGTQYADLSKGQLFGCSAQFNAADYASTLEANFANLINTDDEAEGSITDPYSDGFITLRSNDARIKEGTSFIPTYFPIAKLKKVLMRQYDANGQKVATYDVTKYVFEKQEYDLLSSYSGVFPFTKTHALFYQAGSKNIDGLWFRIEDAANDIFNVFKKYAITNIYNEVTGSSFDDADLNLARISFQITYIPIINGRARQERVENVSSGRLVLAHNQSANKLSARAFGESIRGQMAMMANPDKSKMYLFKDLADVPNPGALYDENSYISNVTTRIFPGFCVCQIDLSENFNALGAYAELKTDIRQYEIPQGEDRFTLLEEMCVVGKKELPDIDQMCTSSLKEKVLRSFQTFGNTEDITAAYLRTYDKDMNAISDDIALPVYSTSLGNSVYFGFSFMDNFAAGVRSVQPTADANETDTKYRISEYVPYGDTFYAMAKYLDFSLVSGFGTGGYTERIAAHHLPNAYRLTAEQRYVQTGAYPLIWNKDSADTGNVAYQMHFVSNDGYVIGSELTRIMPFVRTSGAQDKAAKIYFYNRRINKITGESGATPEEGLVASSTLSTVYDSVDNTYSLVVDTLPSVPFVSWVIKREDNKCLIGKNSNTVDKNIYFNFKRKR